MIVLVSQILEALMLGICFVLLVFAAVWMLREDIGPDTARMREERRRTRGAL